MADKKIPIKRAANKNLNISDATVLEETKTIDPVQQQEKEYTDNLKDQKEVNLEDIGKNKVKETKTIDFLDDAQSLNYTQFKSKQSEAKDENSEKMFGTNDPNELRKQISEAENSAGKEYTIDDFKDIATFIITFIDVGASSFCKWWSKDTTSEPYSLGATNKNILIKQLTRILVKYQTRFPLEGMFIITLLLMYSGAFKAAYDRRKLVKEKSMKIVHNAGDNNDDLKKKSARPRKLQ